MLNVLGKLPRELGVAVSGGPDSMAILDFLSNNHEVTAVYFDHGTDFGDVCKGFVNNFCYSRDIPFVIGFNHNYCPSDESLEEHWRNERYKFLHSFDMPIVTGHNLDDVIEWFLYSATHGEGKVIPYQNKNVFRPFISTSKRSLEDWCESKGVPFMVDPANEDRKFMRSIVRHDILPNARRLNPGIEKTFKKIVEKNFLTSDQSVS
jgi:tRNA(Ile)-lysidine synthase|tara:strand:+ start:241 stop:858 length:618 start_codon:yes stop_codon:yes gene_type:complete